MRVFNPGRLCISVRGVNVLKSMEVDTPEAFRSLKEEDIRNTKNAGEKTIGEIMGLVRKAVRGEIDLEQCWEERVEFRPEQLAEMAKHSVRELGLSARALNGLYIKADIRTVDKAAVLTLDDIAAIPTLGRKSAQEVLDIIQAWVAENIFCGDDETGAGYDAKTVSYFEQMQALLRPIGDFYWPRIASLAKSEGLFDGIVEGGYDNVTDNNVLSMLSVSESKRLLKKMFHEITAGKDIIRHDDMRAIFRARGAAFSLDVLDRALRDIGVREMEPGYWGLERPMLYDYILEWLDADNVKNDRILYMKLQGRTLQSIGTEYGVTREHIRQVCNRRVAKFPLLYEDYYSHVFTYFDLSKDAFGRLFGDSDGFIYEYLSIRYKKGRNALCEGSVKAYDGPFSQEMPGFLASERLRHDRDHMSRSGMMCRVLMLHSDMPLSYDEFKEAYYEYVKRNGFDMDRFRLNDRSATNRLHGARHVAFDRNGRFRYNEADMDRVWNSVDFMAYKGLVISADLIFRDYADLMEELDIRDGYELFSLMKSSVPVRPPMDYGIRFRRVPMMVMGDGDEGHQALQLLREMPSGSFPEFCAQYSERYGVRADVIQGNPAIMDALRPYLTDTGCSIDTPTFDYRDVEGFKAELAKKEIWFTRELEEAFLKCCSNSPEGAFNEAAFRRIGYTMRSCYAYKSKYGSGTGFFEKYIFSQDVVDLSKVDTRIKLLPLFNTVSKAKKESLEYLEAAPKLLLSMRTITRRYGLTRDDVVRLQGTLRDYYDEPYFNAHSLWDQIKDLDLVKKLDGNEWLCTCIMRQSPGVCSINIGDGIILSQDYESLHVAGICGWLAGKYGRMSVARFSGKFQEVFGCYVNSYRVAYKLRSGGHWDELVTDSLEGYLDQCVSGEIF